MTKILIRSPVRCGSLSVSALAYVALAGTAAAAPPRDETTVAQLLFDDGVALKDRGHFAEACPKLEESQRIDPGLGTQYHLADCYEKQGRSAAAWTLFGELARQAAVSGQKERETAARDRAAELTPRVPRLIIAVPADSDAGGLTISVDGVATPRASWNTPLPIDPGAHEIVARVGKRAWRMGMIIDGRSRTETLVVPDLLERDASRRPQGAAANTTGAAVTTTALIARSAPLEAPRTEEPNTTNGRRVAGFAIAAVGIVGLGAGALFTVRSLDEAHAAEDLGCTTRSCKSQDGLDARSRAESARNVAIASFAIGAVATSAGIYLVLSSTSASDSTSKPRLAARATPFGIDLSGAF